MSETGNRELNRLEVQVRSGQGPCTNPCSIAVSEAVSRELAVEPGDPVLVVSGMETVGVVECVEPLNGSAVYLGRLVSANAHAGHEVSLVRLEQAVTAEKVVLTLNGDVGAGLEDTRGDLNGLYLCAGNKIELSGKGLAKIEAVASKVVPDTIVQICETTDVTVRKTFTGIQPVSDFACLGGFEEVLAVLRDKETRLINQPLLEKFGSEPIKGVILYGSAGVGKSLLLDTLMNESRVNCILARASELAGLNYGESERRLREMFAEAREQSPSIVLMDDLDVICPKRGEYSQPEEKRIVSVMQGLLDDISGTDGVMVIATARSPESIDENLRRPGSFDREVEISLPDMEERKEILEIHTARFPLEDGLEMDRVAAVTQGYSGADLKLLTKETLWHAIKRSVPVEDLETLPGRISSSDRSAENFFVIVGEADFLECRKDINPSVGRAFIAEVPDVAWEDVGGYEKEKMQLEKDIVAIWQNRLRARQYGVELPMGILLTGPPGTGKTRLAMDIATWLNSKVIVVRAPVLLSKWMGEYEQNIDRLFEVARKAEPVVVIIDEVETIAGKRGGGTGEGSRALDSGLNVMLQKIDGVEKMHEVFLVCITNRPDMLDDAFTRSGRIGRQIYIGEPDEDARRAIFEVYLRGAKERLEGVDVEELASISKGMVGADIREVVRQALANAFYEATDSGNQGDFVVWCEHLSEALRSVMNKDGRRFR